MLLKPRANHSSNDIIAKLGNCAVLFNTMNHLKPYLHKFPHTQAFVHPRRRAHKYRYMQTPACMLWNKWGACFYCSTFCSFASQSLSPEGHDSSVSGEISCMIEQHSKEMVLSSVWQSPAEQLKEAEAWRQGLCVWMCVCLWLRVGGWHWKVTVPNKSNLTQVRIPKYKCFENYHSSVSCSA